MSGACVPGAVNPPDDEQASREAAEANQAKELFEEMERAWSGNLSAVVYVPSHLISQVIADALQMYEDRHHFVGVHLTLGGNRRLVISQLHPRS